MNIEQIREQENSKGLVALTDDVYIKTDSMWGSFHSGLETPRNTLRKVVTECARALTKFPPEIEDADDRVVQAIAELEDGLRVATNEVNTDIPRTLLASLAITIDNAIKILKGHPL